MNKVILGLIAGLVLGVAAARYLFKPPDAGEAKKSEAPAKEQDHGSFVQHGTNGETFLKLDADTQTRMGLTAAWPAAVQLKPEVKGYGRVLDPGPLAALLAEAAGAKAALAASTREFERLKILHDQGQNASARALEAAEAAMKRDQIALDSVQPRLLLGWGKAVAAQPDLPALVHSLAAQETALVRVDLPLGQSLKAVPDGGRLAALAAPDRLVEARFLGPAPNADPQMQAQGFLLLMTENPLPPGAAVIAWLSVPGEAPSGVVVPREALIRYQGEVFVYVQTGEETFERTQIQLDRPTEGGWFVGQGLQPREKVVVVGGQQLLSEELKGQGGED